MLVFDHESSAINLHGSTQTFTSLIDLSVINYQMTFNQITNESSCGSLGPCGDLLALLQLISSTLPHGLLFERICVVEDEKVTTTTTSESAGLGIAGVSGSGNGNRSGGGNDDDDDHDDDHDCDVASDLELSPNTEFFCRWLAMGTTTEAGKGAANNNEGGDEVANLPRPQLRWWQQPG